MCSVRQLADAILPSLEPNVSLPTCLPLFHSLGLRAPFFSFPPLRFPLLLFLLGRSYLFSLSLSLFPLSVSPSPSFFFPHFLLSTLVRRYKVSFSVFSFVIFFCLCILRLGLLVDASLHTFPSVSTPFVRVFTSPSSRR